MSDAIVYQEITTDSQGAPRLTTPYASGARSVRRIYLGWIDLACIKPGTLLADSGP